VDETRHPVNMPWLAPPAVLTRGLMSTLPAGATISRAGDRVQQAMILVEGTVDEIVGGLVVEHDEPGTLLGPEHALGEQPSTCTLRARSRLVAVAVPAVDLARLATEPDVAAWLAGQLVHHDTLVAAAAQGRARPHPLEIEHDGESGPWRAACHHGTGG
jgi:CRP-like cAMP-binding protein